MPLAVIFGAGNVGRGFIAEILAEADYRVYFIDVDDKIINAINENESYPHFTVSNQGSTKKNITGVRAIHGHNQDMVAQVVADADLVATCVGANALKHIAANLASGISRRYQQQKGPINILLCENLHDAASHMKNYLLPYLPEFTLAQFEQNVGLLETSIGRMIPVPSEELAQLHPAAVKVEPYKFLPYDQAAVKGEIPPVPSLVSQADIPFSFYSDRKLYVHNMGHALCAYLSGYFDCTYIWQGIAVPQIRYFVRCAMLESGIALSKQYNQPLQPIIDHIDDLLYRFGNRELADTVERVGRDPKRKMAAGDRFLGAYQMCRRQNTGSSHISLGLAAGFLFLAEVEQISLDDVIGLIEKTDLFSAAQSYQPEVKAAYELLKRQLNQLKSDFDFSKLIDLINLRYHQAKIV